jgi:hypothetical protein
LSSNKMCSSKDDALCKFLPPDPFQRWGFYELW